jgi:hypothetical protein
MMKTTHLIFTVTGMMVAGLTLNIPAMAQGSYTNIARTCTDPSPMNTQEWMDFKAFVNREYFGSGGYFDETTYTYAYGHALGRLARAVEQIPEREEKFNCVKKALEQTISSASLERFVITKDSPLGAAAMGFYDEEVARETGVTSKSPLYNFFGANGSVQNARPLPQTQAPQSGNSNNGSQNANSVFGTGGIAGGGSPGGTSRYDRTYYGENNTTYITNGILGGTYSDVECTEYANFNLDNALGNMRAATLIGRDFDQRGFTDCNNDGWAMCRDIMAELTEAKNQVTQIFLDATTGNCRKCKLDALQRYGHRLHDWENWLVDHGYNSAWGFAKTFSGAIDDHMNDQKCAIETPSSTTVISNIQEWGVDYGGLNAGPGEIKSSPATDGHTSYFQAPPSLLGDWSNYSKLSFSLKSWGGTFYDIDNADDIPQKGDIIIFNGAKAMAIKIGDNHDGGFKDYNLPLHSGSWKFYGGARSASEILGNVTTVSIRSEYGAGDDWSILRNVKVH